jgi:drug/metabolite transporter (DMT)-like permease
MSGGAVIPLLYAAVCLIWGSTWLAIKIGLDGVPPMLAAGLRFLLASTVLGGLVWWRKTPLSVTKDDKISILSCGIFSFTLSYAFVYWAEERISSGLTAILFCTMPLFVALLSRFWTRTEKLDARKLAGIIVGMAGTAVLFWPRQGISRTEVGGMLLALASSLAAGTNLVTMKKHSRHTDIYLLNAVGMAMGAASLLSLSLATESYAGIVWTRANVLSIVYLALVGSVAAFLAYYHMIKHLDATLLSMITLIFPLVAVALGWAYLKEEVSAQTLARLATVLSGAAIAVGRLPRRRQQAPLPPP